MGVRLFFYLLGYGAEKGKPWRLLLFCNVLLLLLLFLVFTEFSIVCGTCESHISSLSIKVAGMDVIGDLVCGVDDTSTII